MDTIDRSALGFPQKVRDSFSFLKGLGFSEVECLPTIVRYRAGEIEVDVYHGRLSYEVGAGVTIFKERFSASEIIQVYEHDAFNNFQYTTANTPDAITKALEYLSLLMQRFGIAALKGDPEFVSMLGRQRKNWSKDYAVEVLAETLRPKASEAFRRMDYLAAAQMYSRIRSVLSPAEQKKLVFATKKSKSNP